MDEFSNKKSILYYQIILLFVLVILDKSITPGSFKEPDKKSYFQNNIPDFKQSSLNLPEVTFDPLEKKQSDEFMPEKINSHQGIYFLKFSSRGRRVSSTLVRVPRTFRGSLKKRVWSALQELEKGPSLYEQSKGIISGLPPEFHFYKKVRLTDGVLHISLPKSIQISTGGDLMRDRLDQITYTLTEFNEIKGLVVYIEGKKVPYLGTDNFEVPELFTRKDRKIQTLENEIY
jgi:spore germination protein GerM